MEEKVHILLNKAYQKFLKLAKCARENQAYGKSDEEEFCLLTRLKAVIFALETIPDELTYDQFRELEKTVNEIGGRCDIVFRPTVPPSVVPPDKDCGCDNTQEQIENIWNALNYKHPLLELESLDFSPEKYEVGQGNVETAIRWLANKKPLTVITVDIPEDPDFTTVNLSGTIPSVLLPFGSNATQIVIHGFYNDKQAYKGQHLLAEAKLKFETVWPCYWGKGPLNALDDEAGRNAFALSLTRELCCPKCIEADLQAGEVLYYFFPYKGWQKQFVSDNGVIHNSFKGIIEGFRTQSLIDNSLPGETTYGVIRSDQPGIGPLKVCIREVEWPDEVPVEPEPEEVIAYSAVWNGLVCRKSTEQFSSVWSGLVCLKEEPELVTINWILSEWASAPDFIDANMRIYVNEVARLEQFGNGTGSFEVEKGSTVRVQYFYLDIQEGAPVSPRLQLLIDSVLIDSKPVAIPGSEAFNHSFVINADKQITVRAIGDQNVEPVYGQCHSIRIDTTHADYDPEFDLQVETPNDGIVTKRHYLFPSYDDGNDYVVHVCAMNAPTVRINGVSVAPPSWVTISAGTGTCLIDTACLPPITEPEPEPVEMTVTPLFTRLDFQNVPVGPINTAARYNAVFGVPATPREDCTASIVEINGVKYICHFYGEGTFGYPTGMNEFRRIASGGGLQELWWSVRFRYEAGFDLPRSTKFFGVTCGSFTVSEGPFASGGQGPASAMEAANRGGSIRLNVVKVDGKMYLKFYIYDHTMTTPYGGDGDAGNFVEIQADVEYEIVVRNVMNFPLSENNGISQVWVNGVLVASISGFAMSRDYITAKGFHLLMVQTFSGGDDDRWNSSKNQRLYQDRYCAWTTNNPRGNAFYLASERIQWPGGIIGGTQVS